MQFIDIHTHKIKSDADIQILNVFAEDLTRQIPDHLFSSGIHPWHLANLNAEASIEALDQACLLNNLLAVGECGLDKLTEADFALQKTIFKRHIELAEIHHKPLIIHSVRTLNEVLFLKKENPSPVPWILHGYQGSRETTKQLLGHGFYFSVGEALLKNPKLQQVLAEIPIDRLFFETDDRDISIQKIYLFAAQIIRTDVELLAEAIASNFKNLFGDDKLARKN